MADSDDSILDNFENYSGSGLDDDEVNLLDRDCANLSIDCNSNSNRDLFTQENIEKCSRANKDRIDWYKNGITAMKETVNTLGSQRTEASKKFNDVSNQYDQIKKTLYNLIETGLAEGALTDKESSCYKEEIKLIDRRALTDMNFDQKSRKRSHKRARRN